ncbi:unnamed protein product [Rhizoctonia solani]|uniref:DUF4246 domain-containing protein n=1 Tax=Rhizoctonia solani TaxID=456999 RepID=A0A8H3B8M5_9AGAM|nr:unnamed protein product [Rhizoctonia solani]
MATLTPRLQPSSELRKSVKSESRINNLHLIEHADLYKAVEDLLAAFITLFEHIPTDSIVINKVIPGRIIDEFFGSSAPPDPDCYSDHPEHEKALCEWQASRPPVVWWIRKDGYNPGGLEKRVLKYALSGRTIQVIVRLANIHLIPENSEYSGGLWHIDGMNNDVIAAPEICYYHEENITESRLAFHTTFSAPKLYDTAEYRV